MEKKKRLGFGERERKEEREISRRKDGKKGKMDRKSYGIKKKRKKEKIIREGDGYGGKGGE